MEMRRDDFGFIHHMPPFNTLHAAILTEHGWYSWALPIEVVKR